jgi:transcriptional regulator with XRE-family HTH domain
MDIVRIGPKVVDRRKIDLVLDRILEERQRGASQDEVARKLKLDRTFISRLEKLGEVRRGKRIAIVGFPVANRDELEDVARQEGVEFTLLLTDHERWEYVQKKSGLELFNDIMRLIADARQCDVVILLGSDRRVQLLQGLVDRDVVSVELGPSPLRGDVWFPPERLRNLIRQVKD